MWKLLGLLLHIFMLGFISVIYFQTTIINGMTPQAMHRDLGLKPPADRLVVFLVDGLRAEALFHTRNSSMPRVHKLLMERDVMGISYAKAPTETRPGHIALFGGFQEDPSAALTNFRRNPMSFDTILNRTMGSTWAWGAQSVLEPFKLLPSGGAPLNLHMQTPSDVKGDTKRRQSIGSNVHKFLENRDSLKLVHKGRPALFLIDFDDIHRDDFTAKPYSEIYAKALNEVDAVIMELYMLFERTFKDKRTAYLLTSDHGMTDRGTHGGNSPVEIETPFLFWGSGIKHSEDKLENGARDVELPLRRLQQTQLAPLMSVLIGLPPPMNNRAVLPMGLLNVSFEYDAYSLHLNALQLLAQVERVLELQNRSHIHDWMPKFERLDMDGIQQYRDTFKLGPSHDAMMNSQSIIKLALDFLDYNSGYYRIPLMVACLSTYIGWFYYLLAKQTRPWNAINQEWMTIPTLVLLLLGVAMTTVFFLHKVPCCTAFYLLVPVPVWILAIRERGMEWNGCMHAPLMQLAWICGSIVMVIGTFFFKQLIALSFLIVMCVNNGRAFTKPPRMRFWLWLAVVAILTGFTAKRPEFGRNSLYLLTISMLVTILRPLVLNERHAWRVWLSNGAALLLSALIIYQRMAGICVHSLLRGAAWGYVVYAIVSIPYSDTKTPRHRVQLIMFNLSTVYTMMCISYESLFIQLLCTEFLMGIQVKADSKRVRIDDSNEEERQHQQEEIDEVEDADEEGGNEEKPNYLLTPMGHIHCNYRFAVMILVYTYVSMVGTGELPNVNSLDVTMARVFVGECCSMLLIGTIHVMKLALPILIIMSSMYAHCIRARQNQSGIFVCLYLICGVICFYFFFFVRNAGSWNGVRDSLSQQLVVHGTPILLSLFSWVPQQLLSAIPITMLPMLRWKSSIPIATAPGQSLA